MSKKKNAITVTIDNKVIEVKKGQTILQAALRNKIYIPTLCAHEELSPYGGCRMCIVEVEGMRGFPTACTTPAEEGMKIKTRTEQVQNERMGVLQLMLSEHTSSCLICDEEEECKNYMGTIRKAGVTTGCRYCPNDGQCELEEVVKWMGVKEINYPITYRGLRVEKEDPFYDRDYNLCILCGRCIRVCQEIRAASTLAFKQRGRRTIIGPAFGRTHLEAGCEFCGACVSVCPTGTLAEKARKWEGRPEREEITTCAFCGIGCQMRLLIKEDRVIGSLPADDPVVNNGQLCVKGRFCIPEMVNDYQRLRVPLKTQNGSRVEISMNEAIETAALQLSACPPQQFGMLISPSCSNEDLYIAQKFARVVMKSHHIDTTARLFYGNGFNSYLKLLGRSVPLSDLRKASTVLCIGLDAKYGRSVVGSELRRSIHRGAEVFTVNPREHFLSLVADRWLQPGPGEEAGLLQDLVNLTGKKRIASTKQKSKTKSSKEGDDLLAIAGSLKESPNPIILVGSEFMQYDSSRQIFEAIDRLARNIGAGILPLPAQNNLLGSILLGVYPEFLPGSFPSRDKKRLSSLKRGWKADLPSSPARWDCTALASGSRQRVLYLIGENPTDSRPPADFIIFQNIYPPDPSYEADLILPAAAFTESDGTFINGEGRVQRVKKAVAPPVKALPDWEILCRIARKMGVKGFGFKSARAVQREMASVLEGFVDFKGTKRKAVPWIFEGKFAMAGRKAIGSGKPSKIKKATKRHPFLLTASAAEHTYRGFHLSRWVEGSRKIFSEGKIDINPKDARKAKISEGDRVQVTSSSFDGTWRARIVKKQPPGTLHVALCHGETLAPNPHPVRIRKSNV